MTLDSASQKRDVRRHLRAALSALSPEQRLRDSVAACALLRRQSLWHEAQRILFFAPLPGEVDVAPLLREALDAGKTAALPGYVTATGVYQAFVISHLTDDCAPGKYGIVEPAPSCPSIALNRLDLVLAPGLGFDLTGHRLGRGQGFYDRLLANTTAIKCGVAFDAQIVERLPAEAHDVRMNCLLTPTRWLQWPP